VARWLDLYRWEFPLPERDALAAQVAGWLAFYAGNGAVVEDRLCADHPLARVTAGVLENFREAYLAAAWTIAAQTRWPVPRRALLEGMRRQFRVSLLLGELTKPEGNSVVTFGNALSRFAELGYIRLGEAGQGRERWIERGSAHDGLGRLIDDLRGVPGS